MYIAYTAFNSKNIFNNRQIEFLNLNFDESSKNDVLDHSIIIWYIDIGILV